MTGLRIQSFSGRSKGFKTLCSLLEKKVIASNESRVGPYRMKRFCVVAQDAKRRIVGGLVGCTFWDWLYIDLAWIDRMWRGAGLGRAIIHRLEEVARRRGCRQAYVGSWGFQAPGFYQKTGYRTFLRWVGFPPGQTLFLLRKTLAGPGPGTAKPADLIGIAIRTVAGPKKKFDRINKRLGKRLLAFINRKAGSMHPEMIGFSVRDVAGKTIGGLAGSFFGGWAHVDLLWVEERSRRQGVGTKLLKALEKFGAARKARGVSFQAYDFHPAGFFAKSGYRVFGRLAGLPKGHAKLYFSKKML